ncbi:MAG TPA: M3 family metallopeptidase [Planctomycetota bacterium]|nr:M3 family metallopeptidase [Planctomycetota bacterium]
MSLSRALSLFVLIGVASPAWSQALTATQLKNPLFSTSPLPLHYPEFDRIADEHFSSAFDEGMAQQQAEIAAITGNPDAPTFANTIMALEKSGQLLDRATTIFGSLVAADTNPEREKLRSAYSAKFAAHSDAINLDSALFQRIKHLHEKREELNLKATERRLVERYFKRFVRAGAQLDDADKDKLRGINQELAALGTKFSQNVLTEVNDSAVIVDDVRELDGLTETQIAAAASTAKARGHEGKYVLTLLNTTGQPALSQLHHRPLRERIHRASVTRGSRGGPYDNTEIIARIMKLRAEQAVLLGYPHHAAYSLEEQTARTSDAVLEMLKKLAPAALANARSEGKALKEMIDREQAARSQPTFALEAWDWDYYSEKVRREKYSFDESELKPYLELQNVLHNGVFYAATEMFGITFRRRTDLPVYHPDVWVYDVLEEDGTHLAIFIADMYARDSKRGGAWMNSYVSQSELLGLKPVVANHMNIPKPPEGSPTLLTWDEVITAFHEFGHALHGMFSRVDAPFFSGTRVPRDFVEFPSQVNEMCASWPSILKSYALHYETGEPMPAELLAKVLAASKFNQGYATTEYLSAALLDQRWYQLKPDQVPDASGVMAFERDMLARDGFDYAPVPPRYRTPYFSHIMSGYSAGYYSYIWSEVLDAHSVQWFKKNGGLSRKNGEHFRRSLLSRGGSQEAMDLYRAFTGEDPTIEPLLRKRGLDAAVPK